MIIIEVVITIRKQRNNVLTLSLTGVEETAVSPDLGGNWFPEPCGPALRGCPKFWGLTGCQAFGGTWLCTDSPIFGAGLYREQT